MDSILSAYADTLNEQISPEAVREATEFGTVPSGTYLATVAKKEWREAYQAFNGRPAKPNRLRYHLPLALRDQVTGQRRGVVFADISPIPGRFDNGNLDNLSRLWGHMAAVHEAPKRHLKAGQLADEVGTYEYLVTIKEKFIDEKSGQFHTAMTQGAGPAVPRGRVPRHELPSRHSSRPPSNSYRGRGRPRPRSFGGMHGDEVRGALSNL